MATRLRTMLCLAALALVTCAPRFIPSAEDAAILFQYSDNLARTGAISYTPHGPHVEGATDFLWMVILATARSIHISPHAATGPLNAFALLGIAWIFAHSPSTPFAPRLLLWTPVLFLLTPQMAAALSGFSVLPFAFLLALMLHAYVRRQHRLVALSALLLCLLRPDGLVFALPLLAFDLARRRFSATAWRDQLVVYYLPAAVYTAWRMLYFHQLFPLPFLVKSQAERWLGLIVIESLRDISRYLSLGLLTIALLWRWKVLRGATLAIAISGIVVPTLFYITMRLDQNLADRFFFFLLLVPAFLLCMHRDRLAGWTNRSRFAALATLAALFLWPYLFALVHLATDRYLTNSLVAREIKRQRLQGTMALSEAGTLPYETGWPATDLWGLNTAQFAPRLIQPADIAPLAADLIVLHFTTCNVSPNWPPPSPIRTWPHMAQNVLRGASAAGYEEFALPYNQSTIATAATRFTDGEPSHLCYFIRPAYPDRPALEHIIEAQGGVKLSFP